LMHKTLLPSLTVNRKPRHVVALPDLFNISDELFFLQRLVSGPSHVEVLFTTRGM
jgi:hypothetical protein